MLYLIATILIVVSIILLLVYSLIPDSDEDCRAREGARREQLLFEERLRAERAKQCARNAGDYTLQRINEIANAK
jgi:hypothetical protein